MTTLDEPPWASQPCPACGRPVPLDTHELTCPCFSPRTRLAVAWICDRCNLVVGLVGLFTSWAAAVSARQRELDRRGARHIAETAVKPDR
jgi:hypothetical protein